MKARPGIVLTGIIAVIAGVMLVVFITEQSTKPGTKVDLGADVFQVGRAQPLATEIAKRGPVLNPALIKGGPDIYIQHLGTDPATGWHAFEARQPTADRRCTLEWKDPPGEFRDPCTNQTFPADGAGLRSYLTAVTDGQLTVDFRSPGAAQ